MRFYSILGTVLGARDTEVTGTHLGARGLLVSVSLKSWPSARCSGRSGAQLRGRHSHYSWWKLPPLQVGAWRAWCCPCEWPGGMCQLEQGTGAWVGDGEESLPTLQGREASWRGHWSMTAARAVQTLISSSLQLGGRVKFWGTTALCFDLQNRKCISVSFSAFTPKLHFGLSSQEICPHSHFGVDE